MNSTSESINDFKTINTNNKNSLDELQTHLDKIHNVENDIDDNIQNIITNNNNIINELNQTISMYKKIINNIIS